VHSRTDAIANPWLLLLSMMLIDDTKLCCGQMSDDKSDHFSLSDYLLMTLHLIELMQSLVSASYLKSTNAVWRVMGRWLGER
jgi:hypothetical protein